MTMVEIGDESTQCESYFSATMDSRKEYKKGLWTEEEDRILMEYVRVHGKGRWSRVSKFTSLKRCGKSCRLRWINYLSPHVKLGDFSEEEEELIIRLHNLLGNRWSLIAGRVPGRTDNQVKNYWNNYLNKKKLGVTKSKGRISHSSDPLEKQDRNELSISSNVPSESVSEPVSRRVGGSDGDKAVENVGDEIRGGGFESSDFWLSTPDVDLHVMDPFFGASDNDFAWDGYGF